MWWFKHVSRRSSFVASAIMAVAATALLAACGFQLKGAANYPFTSVYVQRPTFFGVATANVSGSAAPVVP